MTERPYEGGELELFSRATRWKSYWAAKLKPFVKGRILEVGAGIGSNAVALAARAPDHWTLLEPDPKLCERIDGRIHAGELPGGTRVVCGILDNLPARAAFDAVLYIDVLEHIQADNRELEEAFRRLAPGGHLIVLAPAYQALFSPFDEAIGHHRRYSRRSLVRASPPHARLVRAFYLDSVGLALSATNRFLLRQRIPTAATIAFWDKAVVPLSRVMDPIIGFNAGRSVIVVWSKDPRSEAI